MIEYSVESISEVGKDNRAFSGEGLEDNEVKDKYTYCVSWMSESEFIL